MLVTLLVTATLAATAFSSAIPNLDTRQSPVCLGTYGNAQCCATDVLNLADLNCFNREYLYVTAFCVGFANMIQLPLRLRRLRILKPSAQQKANKPSVALCLSLDRLYFARILQSKGLCLAMTMYITVSLQWLGNDR